MAVSSDKATSKKKAYGYLADKDALVKRLKRVEGQVRGIERMVEEERYCIDILTQISAATTALDALGLKLLEQHVSSCWRLPCRRRSRCGGQEPRADRSRREVHEGALRRARVRAASTNRNRLCCGCVVCLAAGRGTPCVC